MHIPIIPLMNVKDSVWFQGYAHDHNYGDTQSSEEAYQEAGPLSEEDSTTDTPMMDSALLDGIEQDHNQEELGSIQNPPILNWWRNLSVLNYLDQVSESLLAEHILVV